MNPKQISNPFSTGGGGHNFEIQVQASFVALMLAGGFAPCLPCRPIQKVKLQGRYSGYETDDLIVFTSNEDDSEGGKLLGQIKHSVTISESDPVFGGVIASAWRDFQSNELFIQGRDAIALITGPLSATDINDVRTILEWARSSESAHDFLTKVGTAKFSSQAKREKLKAFRTHVDATSENSATDEVFFSFLQHFHLLGYDLDIKSGVMHAFIHSLIGQHTRENSAAFWAQIIQEVMSANQSAGTINRKSLPEDLLKIFGNRSIQTMPDEISRTVAPRDPHDWKTSEFAAVLSVAALLGSWSEKLDADMAIVRRFAGGQFEAWPAKLRELMQITAGPLILRNGVWAVKNRDTLWEALGSCVFDGHLDLFKEITLAVLKVRDPQFELNPEERYAASIYGKVLANSKQLRKGLAEGLALLGSRSETLVNCSARKPELTAILIVRELFEASNWALWGSLNDMLPSIAEASPDEFLNVVERALSQSPCPFDELFNQEGVGITGTNYLTGLLWALETLAWDDQYLVRVTVLLGALAERDPGGQWANRPLNSLITIFLPWLPQTMAGIDKRKVAVQTLCRESSKVAWKLLVNLLPDQVRSSSHTHKPIWRKVIPENWENSTTQADYWIQVSSYTEMIVNIAVADKTKLKELVEHLDVLPAPEFKKILQHISSAEFVNKPEEERLDVWNSLKDFALKHRRFADADWALPEDLISEIEKTSDRISPQNPMNLYRRLFCGRDRDLYEEKGNWQEQEKGLELSRQKAVQEILKVGGIESVIEFVVKVESPHHVGFSVGSVGEDDIDAIVLPTMLNTAQERDQKFAGGFIWARFHRKSWPWVDKIIAAKWTKAEIAQLLTTLPFTRNTWERSEKYLGEESGLYWKKVAVNPFQAQCDLSMAIDKLLQYGRPWMAIDCLGKILQDNQSLDSVRAIKALLSAVNTSEAPADTYDAVEIIKALQNDPNANQEDLFKIEWAYLPLLKSHNGSMPRLLNNRLASDPNFFCEVIRTVYNSKKGPRSIDRTSKEQEGFGKLAYRMLRHWLLKIASPFRGANSKPVATSEQLDEQTEKMKAVAQNAYCLLQEWKILPGTTNGEGFSGEAFKGWIETVIKLVKESGHVEVALIHIGGVLTYAPTDSDGLWMHRDVADILNERDFEEMRRGFSSAIHNSRGVHWVDPTGKPELELANTYRFKAESMENEGYQRIAVTLRNVAKAYDREAERVIADHKMKIDEDC